MSNLPFHFKLIGTRYAEEDRGINLGVVRLVWTGKNVLELHYREGHFMPPIVEKFDLSTYPPPPTETIFVGSAPESFQGLRDRPDGKKFVLDSLAPDGRHLVYFSSRERQYGLWRVEDGKVVATWESGAGGLFPGVYWSQDSRYVAITSRTDGQPRFFHLWDVQSNYARRTFAPTIGTEALYLTRWLPNNRYVIANGEGCCGIWDVEAMGFCFAQPAHHAIIADWSPDGKWVLLSGEDLSSVYNLDTGSILTVPGKCSEPAFTNHSLAYLGDDGLCVCDLATGNIKLIAACNKFDYCSYAWSPNGRCILMLNEQKRTMEIIDVVEGRVLASHVQKSGLYRRIAWSPDGKLVALGVSNRLGARLEIWEVADSSRWEHPLYIGPDVSALTWSPDSKYIAAARDITVEVRTP